MKICESLKQTMVTSNCNQLGPAPEEALLQNNLSIYEKQTQTRKLMDEAKQQLLALQARNNKDLKQFSNQKQHSFEHLQQKLNSYELFQTDEEQRRSNSINLINLSQLKKLHQKLDSIQKKMADLKNNLHHKKLDPQTSNSHTQLKLSTLVTQEPEKSGLYYPTNHSAYNTNQSAYNLYYISELLRAYHDQRSLAREHLNSTLSILKMIDLSKKPTDEEIKKCEVCLPKKLGCKGKKTLVFDLDQTLVHCNYSPTALCDVRLPIKTGTGEVIEAAINVRPYAKQILSSLSKHFEIVIFTASHSSYASVVIDYLDEKKEWVHHRLFRENCLLTSQGLYVKDLRVINRELKDTILVDNAAYSYAYQLENAVPILPYYHGAVDCQLRKLEEYLLKLSNVEDVREEICKTFKLNSYRNYLERPESLVEQLYMSE